jgi:group I intron endonuclease
MVIYKTTNLVNGKQYIGKDSKNNPKYLGSGSYLKRAIRKYGKENFKKEILEICSTREELIEREEYWLNYYDAGNNHRFYNTHNHSYGAPKLSQEIIEKIRRANSGKNHSQYGKTKTEETKRKIGNANRGRVPSEETRRKISEAGRRRSQSEETRKKLSEIRKSFNGKTGMYGKKHSEETKQKMRESAKARLKSEQKS